MLARFQMIRGKRPPETPAPEGARFDTRKHTRPRPTAASRTSFASPGAARRTG